MAKQTINIGTAANDGTGNTIRAAMDICNDNFTELYPLLSYGTIANGDTTPDVSSSRVFFYDYTGGSTTITTLDNAVKGAIYTLVGSDEDNTLTLNNAGNFDLLAGSRTLHGGDVLQLLCLAPNSFVEILFSEHNL